MLLPTAEAVEATTKIRATREPGQGGVPGPPRQMPQNGGADKGGSVRQMRPQSEREFFGPPQARFGGVAGREVFSSEETQTPRAGGAHRDFLVARVLGRARP